MGVHVEALDVLFPVVPYFDTPCCHMLEIWPMQFPGSITVSALFSAVFGPKLGIGPSELWALVLHDGASKVHGAEG